MLNNNRKSLLPDLRSCTKLYALANIPKVRWNIFFLTFPFCVHKRFKFCFSYVHKKGHEIVFDVGLPLKKKEKKTIIQLLSLRVFDRKFRAVYTNFDQINLVDT
jgi:hypothetical protein